MPFVDTKASVEIRPEQEVEIKARLGKATTCIPGKTETWLMTGFQGNYSLYFGGDNSRPSAFVEVSVFGGEDPKAFSAFTGKVCEILQDVLGIEPDRVYVRYQAGRNWGWNGSNF